MQPANVDGLTMFATVFAMGFLVLFLIVLWGIIPLLRIRSEMKAVGKKVGAAAVLLLATGPFLCSKPKTRVFRQPCSVVFPAAEKMSSEKPYHILLDGKQDMILRVQTGSFWKAGAADIDVQFTAGPDGTCTVTDNSPYSGVRRNGTVFLDRLEKSLN